MPRKKHIVRTVDANFHLDSVFSSSEHFGIFSSVQVSWELYETVEQMLVPIFCRWRNWDQNVNDALSVTSKSAADPGLDLRFFNSMLLNILARNNSN